MVTMPDFGAVVAPTSSSQLLKATPLANVVSMLTALLVSDVDSPVAQVAVEGSGLTPFLNHS